MKPNNMSFQRPVRSGLACEQHGTLNSPHCCFSYKTQDSLTSPVAPASQETQYSCCCYFYYMPLEWIFHGPYLLISIAPNSKVRVDAFNWMNLCPVSTLWLQRRLGDKVLSIFIFLVKDGIFKTISMEFKY